jgi:hypothetical protein
LWDLCERSIVEILLLKLSLFDEEGSATLVSPIVVVLTSMIALIGVEALDMVCKLFFEGAVIIVDGYSVFPSSCCYLLPSW